MYYRYASIFHSPSSCQSARRLTGWAHFRFEFSLFKTFSPFKVCLWNYPRWVFSRWRRERKKEKRMIWWKETEKLGERKRKPDYLLQYDKQAGIWGWNEFKWQGNWFLLIGFDCLSLNCRCAAALFLGKRVISHHLKCFLISRTNIKPLHTGLVAI